MTIKELKKWFWEHTFESLLGVVVFLSLSIGSYFLTTIKSQVDGLQCRVAEFGARNEFAAAQLRLVGTALEDLRIDSDYYRSFERIISGYQRPLSLCDEGKSVLSDIMAYKEGLDAAINKDWDTALRKFESISVRTALSEKSIAAVLFHQYLAYKAQKDPRAENILNQARSRLDSAYRLASGESDYLTKQNAIAYLRCDELLLAANDNAATKCFSDLVTGGMATYVVYYNLAALSARHGNFEEAIKEMTLCMSAPGGLRPVPKTPS